MTKAEFEDLLSHPRWHPMCKILKFYFVIWFSAFLGVYTACAATSSSRDKGPIPPDLFFEFIPIPAEENAIIDWRKARPLTVSFGAAEQKMMSYAWTPGAQRPGDEEMNHLQAWLGRNQTALEIFDLSRKKPKAQWPGLASPQEEEPALASFPLLMRARLIAADELAEKREFVKAVESLEGSIQLANQAIKADGALIQYLLGARCRTMTEGAILRLASRDTLPLALLKRLLQDLPRLGDETNIYARHLNVEFSLYSYPSTEVNKLVERWTKAEQSNNVVEMLFPDEFQRPFKVLLDPSLVFRHPLPLDEKVEIERSIKLYRSFRSNSVGSWSQRDLQLEIEREQSESNLLKDIQPLMKAVKKENLPLSRPAAERVLPLYLKLTNPIGRIFECSYSRFLLGDLKVFEYRTEREATRAALAVLIYERSKGHLPASLDELVNEKILDAAPMDYFAALPLHYSQGRRIIWSVGLNGEDDGGKGDSVRHWIDKDAVWRIPELKK